MEPIIFPTPEMVDGYVRASKIEELKKLKKEMLGYIVITLKDETNRVILEHNKTIYSNIGIIDKRIAELKGEQK